MIPAPELAWMFPDDACEALAELVAATKPQLIVECGSGRSTLVLAALCEQGHPVVSLEHDACYRQETQRMLREHDLTELADVRLAPLEGSPPWYAAAAYEDLHGIGLLFVDGPPGSVVRDAREPALPMLRDRLLPGGVIVLEDTHRRDEQEIWRRWGLAATVHVPHSEGALTYGRLT